MGPILPFLLEAAKATTAVACTVNALSDKPAPQPPVVVKKKNKKKNPKPVVIQQPQPQPMNVPPINLVININIYKDGKKIGGGSTNDIPKIETNSKGIDVGVF